MTTKIENRSSKESIVNLKRILPTILLNIKYVFSNKRILLMICSMSLFSILIGSIFMPIFYSGGLIILISVIVPGLIILGAIGSNIKKSSLYKNVLTSGIKRSSFYLSQLISIIIIVNILSAFIWIIIWFLGHFNFFLKGWAWEGVGRMKINPFSNWSIIPILYITNVTALMIFSVYFLIDSFIKDSKTYNIIIVAFLIIGIIFGGSLNSYFDHPYNYQLYNFSNTEAINGVDYYRTGYNGTIYVTDEFYYSSNYLEDVNNYYGTSGIEPHGGMFPNFMFVPTLIFNPFYAVGEFTTEAVTRNMCQEYLWHFNQQIVIVDELLFSNGAIDTIGMNIIKDIPTIQRTSMTHLSVWSWFKLSFDGTTWMWSLVLLQPYVLIFTYLMIGSFIRKLKRN